jgi:hypothetical protein
VKRSPIGRIALADQRHVAEDARVAGDVDALPGLELDHEADGIAAVGAVRQCAGVEGLRHRDLEAVRLDGAAGVHADRIRRPLLAKPVGDLVLGDRRRVAALGDRCGIGDVVGVSVRHEHDVGRGLVRRRGARRIAGQPGIDQHVDAAGRLDVPGRMTKPGDRGVLGHRVLLGGRSRKD